MAQAALVQFFAAAVSSKTCATPFCCRQLKMSQLLVWMRDTMVTERPELFMKGDSV